MAMWIALAAVSIALILVFLISSRSRAVNTRDGSANSGTTISSASDFSDCGSDGGGGCD